MRRQSARSLGLADSPIVGKLEVALISRTSVAHFAYPSFFSPPPACVVLAPPSPFGFFRFPPDSTVFGHWAFLVSFRSEELLSLGGPERSSGCLSTIVSTYHAVFSPAMPSSLLNEELVAVEGSA